MNPKAKILNGYFQKEGLTFFQKNEIRDKADTVSFVTALPIGSFRLVCGIITDTSIFTTIRVNLGRRLPDFPDRAGFLAFLRKLNADHALFKYTESATGTLYLDLCLPADDAHFDPDIIRTSIHLLIYHLDETYPAIVAWLTTPGDAADAF